MKPDSDPLEPRRAPPLQIVPELLTLLRGQIEPTVDDRSIRERAFVVVVSLVAVPILVGFALEIWFTPEEPRALIAVHLGTAVVLLTGGVLAISGAGHVVLAALSRTALLGLFAVMVLAFLFIRDDFSILWVGLLPPLFVFVCGLREGLLWCAAVLLVWLALLSRPDRFAALGASAPWPGSDERVDFALAFLCLAAVASGFELLRMNARQRLQEQLEAQLQKSRLEAVGALTSGVAHDFNNLLTVIRGNLDLAVLGAERASVEIKGLDRAIDATDRAGALTGKLLSYARRQPLQAESIEVATLLDTVRGLLVSSVGRDVEITVRVGDASLRCHCDRGQLENALINLAMNARDAMAGPGRIDLEAAPHRELDGALDASLAPGDYVRITVTDTGPGIPAAVRARIFEPYFSTKPPGAGTGLGLSMVQGFARQSAGDVRVVDRRGSGARIALFLPVATAEPAGAAHL